MTPQRRSVFTIATGSRAKWGVFTIWFVGIFIAAGPVLGNQMITLVGQWWAGLLTAEVAWLALVFAAPAVVGVALGMHLFNGVDHARVRHLAFTLLFVLGLTLCLRG